MIKSPLKATLCLVGLLSSSAALATINTYTPKESHGFYAGVDLGYGLEASNTDDYGYGTEWNLGSYGLGLGAQLGYQFTRYFAVEFDNLNIVAPANDNFKEPIYFYSYFDSYSVKLSANSLSYFGLALKLILPLNHNARLIAKIGGGVNRFSISGEVTNLYTDVITNEHSASLYGAFQTGLGFSYLINSHHELDFMYNSILSDNIYGNDGLTSVNFFTVGYNYHFSS